MAGDKTQNKKETKEKRAFFADDAWPERIRA